MTSSSPQAVDNQSSSSSDHEDTGRPPPPKQRPLSPHLQIYTPLLTMVMSIVHRITGCILYGGMLFFTIWLLAVSFGPSYFDAVSSFYRSFLGQLILITFTWSLFHHMLGGIRHFIWDLGYGYEETQRFFLARATLIGSISLTILCWIVIWTIRAV